MKKIIIHFLAIFFSVNGFGQITFQKTYGGINWEWATSLKQAADGGYYILGTTNSFGADTNDVYLLKTDADGNLLWSKTFGGSGYDNGTSLLVTAESNLIILGSTTSFGAGNSDIYLIKTDGNGNLIWSKTYGGINDDGVASIQQTSDGGFIIVGNTSSFGAGNSDVYAIRTDVNGDTLWTKTYGATMFESATSVRQASDGGFIIAGGTNRIGKGSIYIIKTNSQGDLSWSRTYGDWGRNYTNQLLVTNNNGEIFICDGRSSPGVHEVCLMKMENTGHILWVKKPGGMFSNKSFTIGANGEFIISGSKGAHQHFDASMVRCDSNGNIISVASYLSPYPHFQSFMDAFQTNDGGFIMAGTTDYYGLGYYDILLVKTDLNRNSGCNDSLLANGTTMNDTILSFDSSTVVSPTNTVVNIPNTIVGTGCITTTICYAVGITEASKEDNIFSLSPNPATSELRIENAELRIEKIELYDLIGEKVFQSNISNLTSQISIEVSQLHSGIYFVRVKTDKGIRAAKFVKE